MVQRILFLCTENSARSQMAEALVNSQYSDQYLAVSAGTAPTQVDERALNAIEQFGLDGSNLRSKSVEEFAGQRFDYTITLCDKVQSECQTHNFGGQHIAWDFPDPKSRVAKKPFEVTLSELNERFKMFNLVLSKGKVDEPINPLQLFKCLAEETRLLSLLLILEETELCVCELTTALDLSQPKISRHLAQLRECGLLTDRRQGQWIFYQIDPTLPDWAYVILKEAKRRSVIDLTPYRERILSMGDRPARTNICCA